jgi:hypothetical protein
MTKEKVYLRKIEKDAKEIAKMVDEAIKKLERVAA